MLVLFFSQGTLIGKERARERRVLPQTRFLRYSHLHKCFVTLVNNRMNKHTVWDKTTPQKLLWTCGQWPPSDPKNGPLASIAFPSQGWASWPSAVEMLETVILCDEKSEMHIGSPVSMARICHVESPVSDSSHQHPPLHSGIQMPSLPMSYFPKRKSQDFPGGSVVKNLPSKAGERGSIPCSGKPHVPGSN